MSRAKTKYEDIVKMFENKGCRLVTSEDEYKEKNMIKKDKFKYIAKCGHENEIRGSIFMNGFGINCKNCQSKNVDEENKIVKSFNIHELINHFVSQLNETIEWKLTPDKYGLSDVFIRKCGCENWIRVQIRFSATLKIRVNVNVDIDYFIVVCFSNNEDVWVIPKEDSVKKLAITKSNNTKYHKYKIEKKDLVTELHKHIQLNHKSDTTKRVKSKGLSDKTLTYNDVKNIFQIKCCDLLTLENEYIENEYTTKSLLSVKMKCTHIESISTHSFTKRKYHTCVNCTYLILKDNGFDQDMRVCTGNKQEAEVFQFIKNLIQDTFVVVKAHEGCLCDMIVKLINIETDTWMGIQLKSRTVNNNIQYSFSKIGKYPNMIVICVSLPEFKIWCFEGNDLIGNTSITIGSNQSKYSQNKINNEDLCNTLITMYDKVKKSDLATLMIPSAPSAQKEHSNRLERENLLYGCTFEYPIIDGTKYDVIINGYKVQDKCASAQQKGSNHYGITLEGYIKGDNDYYWINVYDKNGFYIIKEDEMLCDDGINIKKKFYLSKKYDKYFYKKTEVDKIKELFI